MKRWLLHRLWIVWAFCQPSVGELDLECISVRCWRPWVHDGLCMYHTYRYLSDGRDPYV